MGSMGLGGLLGVGRSNHVHSAELNLKNMGVRTVHQIRRVRGIGEKNRCTYANVR